MQSTMTTAVHPGTTITAVCGVVYELRSGSKVNIPPGYIVEIVGDYLRAEPKAVLSEAAS